MGTPATLTRLLEHPALWRAGQLHQGAPAARASGFAELDAHLPGGGWPETGLAEFLLGTTGIGELRVLAPLIGALSREQPRWIAWVNPPFTPYAPALAAMGIDLGRMLVINARTHQEALWALEQTSRSGSCSLALAWLDERQLQPKDTRRLQFAAQQGHMLTCLFRPEHAAATHSMAELRMQLAPAEPGTLTLDIRKRRGGWPVTGIRLQIDESERPEALQTRLSLWRRGRQRIAAMTAPLAAGHAHRRDVLDAPADRSVGLPSSTDSRVPQVTH
jgi:cell division inhibitor SulA